MKEILEKIDKYLNSVTMYRLVLYGLMTLAAYAILAGFFGFISYGGLALCYSLVILFMSCWFANLFFAKLFGASINYESPPITALILFFIMMPAVNVGAGLILVIASVFAMAFKYMVAIKGKHVFNPAALSLVVLGVLGAGNAIWWVGSKIMFIAVLIVGIIIVRKVRKFHLFFSFLGAYILAVLVLQPAQLIQNLASYGVIFMGTIMLTEPQTLPPTKRLQISYGVLVGILAALPFKLLIFYPTPELALIIGNIFSYVFSMKLRLDLRLKEKRELSKDTYEFSFVPKETGNGEENFTFQAGQYLEWMLPHEDVDERGVRRYFTIASSPTESELKIGVKFLTPSSSFKKKLLSLETGQGISATSLLGDFVLPKEKSEKLCFIAGGIGVTPFRSMIKYLSDKGEARDIILIYSVKSDDEIAYISIFKEAAEKIGVRTIYLSGKFLDEDYIKKEVTDWEARKFYLSGPNAMVENYKGLLKRLGIKRSKIKTDYFPGY